MKIDTTGQNAFSWHGLTKGKLLTIKHAVEEYAKKGYHPVATDLWLFLEKDKTLDAAHPFNEGAVNDNLKTEV